MTSSKEPCFDYFSQNKERSLPKVEVESLYLCLRDTVVQDDYILPSHLIKSNKMLENRPSKTPLVN